MDTKCSAILISFWSLLKTNMSRCLTQNIAGVHGHASKLKELLADMILRPHLARSTFPPGPDPGHKSPARPAPCSHTLNASPVVPCLSLPKLIAFDCS